MTYLPDEEAQEVPSFKPSGLILISRDSTATLTDSQFRSATTLVSNETKVLFSIESGIYHTDNSQHKTLQTTAPLHSISAYQQDSLRLTLFEPLRHP